MNYFSYSLDIHVNIPVNFTECTYATDIIGNLYYHNIEHWVLWF